MNRQQQKDIFKFHFWAEFEKRKVFPFNWPQATFEAVIFGLLGCVAVANGRDIATFGWQDFALAAVLPLVVVTSSISLTAIWGLIKGLKAVADFQSYDTISRSPGYKAFYLTPDQLKFKKFCNASIPKEKERIIASANVDSEGTVWAVLCPGRHHHVLWYMADFDMNRESRQQGFLTNKYRFLGRQDARALAIASGQCTEPGHSRDLFSEDLWDTPPHLAQKA